MISEWWNSMDLSMQLLWGITVVASVIFLVQSVMTFVGADVDGGIDGLDVDADDPSSADGGSNLYTFRNLVNFCLGFGWTAILLHDSIPSVPVRLAVAFVAGAALVAAVMYLFKWLSGMQQSGNINVFKSAVGCHGTAYLKVPASRAGAGKVQITINNSVREYDALTDGDEDIPTGAPVTVIEVIDGATLLVEKQDSIII